jgi:serine/threonine protein kinase
MASLTEILGQYLNDYKDLFSLSEEDSNRGIIYQGYNIKDNRECTLKIISKQQLKLGDYDFLLQQVNREEEITQLCQSENIIKLYRRLETKDYIIFEFEFYKRELKSYFLSHDKLDTDILFFKEIS